MSEKTPNNPDYIKRYPNAIQDIDKAHMMANAANHTETYAAGVRWLINDALVGAKNESDFQDSLLMTKIRPDQLGAPTHVPEHYKDVVDVYLDADENHPDEMPDVDLLVGAVEEHNAAADATYKFIGESYDKIKATKR